jgi:hypothetical protein
MTKKKSELSSSIKNHHSIFDKPSKINILGRDFDVNYLATPKDVDSDGKDDLLGQTLHNKSELRILGTLKQYDSAQTLLHEIIHVINEDLKLGLYPKYGKNWENIVDLLAIGILDTFSRNGWLK